VVSLISVPNRKWFLLMSTPNRKWFLLTSAPNRKWFFNVRSQQEVASRTLSCPHAVLLLLLRNPPADHWVLVSGLPTYVAETGLVSVSSRLPVHFILLFFNSLLHRVRGELQLHLKYSTDGPQWSFNITRALFNVFNAFNMLNVFNLYV